jgi:Sodium/calcium exchanger protein
MNLLAQGDRSQPLLWMLIFVPIVLTVEGLAPATHTVLFVLAVLAIIPLAALLSHATGSVAARTGDAIGGLLNATLGNLTELIIATAARRAGENTLVPSTRRDAVRLAPFDQLRLGRRWGGPSVNGDVDEVEQRSAPSKVSIEFGLSQWVRIPFSPCPTRGLDRSFLSEK